MPEFGRFPRNFVKDGLGRRRTRSAAVGVPQPRIRDGPRRPRPYRVLSTEPRSPPLCRVRIQRRCVDRTGPDGPDRDGQCSPRRRASRCGDGPDRRCPSLPGRGRRTDCAAQALNAFLAGSGADSGPRSRLADGVSHTRSRDRERFLRTAHACDLCRARIGAPLLPGNPWALPPFPRTARARAERTGPLDPPSPPSPSPAHQRTRP